MIRNVIGVIVLALTVAGCSNAQEIPVDRILSGTNGSLSPGLNVYRSKDEVRNSWVGKAVSSGERKSIYIDFSRQSLLVITAGARTNVATDLEVVRVRASRGGKPRLNVNARIGVFNESCKSQSVSYPFAVIAVAKDAVLEVATGIDIQNYEVACNND